MTLAKAIATVKQETWERERIRDCANELADSVRIYLQESEKENLEGYQLKRHVRLSISLGAWDMMTKQIAKTSDITGNVDD